jgi:hypothetical protein
LDPLAMLALALRLKGLPRPAKRAKRESIGVKGGQNYSGQWSSKAPYSELLQLAFWQFAGAPERVHVQSLFGVQAAGSGTHER